MELFVSHIKKFLIFSEKKAFLIFWETQIPKNLCIFQEMEPSYIVTATFLLSCFVFLKGSTCETRKNVFLFHLNSLFRY